MSVFTFHRLGVRGRYFCFNCNRMRTLFSPVHDASPFLKRLSSHAAPLSSLSKKSLVPEVLAAAKQ